MRLSTFFSFALIAGHGLIALHAKAQAQEPSCRSLSVERNQGVLLIKSGEYCMQTDIWIDNAGIFVAHGRDRPGFAAEVVHDDVTLDLQGNVAHSGNTTYGVRIRPDTRNIPKGVTLLPLPKRVTIRNGKIESVNSGGISSGLSNMVIPSDLGDPLESIARIEGKSANELDELREFTQKLHLSTFDQQTALRPTNAADYEKRDIHLENLHIFVRGLPKGTGAGGGAINIEGAGTVIRNCVIETEDGNAIWIFGPHALIENNIIVVHGTNRLREADAAIRLIQADGAIIRNNKIVIKDKAHRRGISVFDTGHIAVENNTFYGMTAQDEVARAFTGTLQMTERGSQFEPGWKAIFLSK